MFTDFGEAEWHPTPAAFIFILFYVLGYFCLHVCVPDPLLLELHKAVRCHLCVCEPQGPPL